MCGCGGGGERNDDVSGQEFLLSSLCDRSCLNRDNQILSSSDDQIHGFN